DSEPILQIYLEDVAQVIRTDVKPFSFELRTHQMDYLIACKNESEVFTWMNLLYQHSRLKTASQPTDFRHPVHVEYNKRTGKFSVH
ncbi:Protein kinase, partial [Coelomomyces lativittatus]